VIHHTFDEFEDNNLNNLFEKPKFKECLSTCEGLLVFSKYLADQIIEKCNQIGLPIVPVIVICHPVPSVDSSLCFSLARYVSNPRIFHIGRFLRDSFSLYKLEIFPGTLVPKKCILRGVDMSDVSCPENLIIEARNGTEIWSLLDRDHVPRHRFLGSLAKTLQHWISSVQVFDKVGNEEYDHILASSLVFLDLVDASAVNTLLECIVRHTPILINRHPAVLELLGDQYPMFYRTLEEASEKASNLDVIKSAQLYLQRIPKSKFTYDTFRRGFRNAFIETRKESDANP
jgi:hypothetical protein